MKRFLIYLIGKPGIGKYTTAKELTNHNYILCDNQLVNIPIFSLLRLELDNTKRVSDFDWSCIEKIRDVIFDFIAHDHENNYVLTNVLLDDPEDQKIISKIKNIAEKNSSIFVPVRMHLHDENEHLARIQKPERKLRFKTTDPSDLEKGKNLIDITDNNLLDLDITGLSTKKIVEKIMRFTESLNN